MTKLQKLLEYAIVLPNFNLRVDVAQERKRDCKHDRFWVRLLPLEIIFLVFSFLRSCVEAKRGVNFRHSIRLQQSALNGKQSVLTLLKCNRTLRIFFFNKYYKKCSSDVRFKTYFIDQ